MIRKNAAECRLCGDVIRSTHVHDFKHCRCGEIFVDGGSYYLRHGARDLNNIIDRSLRDEDWLRTEPGALLFEHDENPFADLEEFDFTLMEVDQ